MTESINLDKDILENAKFSAAKVKDTYLRKRAYALNIAANAAAKFLNDKGLKISSGHSLYKSPVFAEEIELADIYFGEARFDVRVTFNDNTFCVPKTHSKFGIKPSAYIVVKFDSSLSNIEFFGYVPENELDYQKTASEYYTFSNDILKPIEQFSEYAKNLEIKPHPYDEKEHENIKEICLNFVDNQTSEAEKIYFIKHIIECPVCRETFRDMNDFDDILSQLKNYNELLNDSTLSVLSGNKTEVDQAAIANLSLVENAQEDTIEETVEETVEQVIENTVETEETVEETINELSTDEDEPLILDMPETDMLDEIVPFETIEENDEENLQADAETQLAEEEPTEELTEEPTEELVLESEAAESIEPAKQESLETLDPIVAEEQEQEQEEDLLMLDTADEEIHLEEDGDTLILEEENIQPAPESLEEEQNEPTESEIQEEIDTLEPQDLETLDSLEPLEDIIELVEIDETTEQEPSNFELEEETETPIPTQEIETPQEKQKTYLIAQEPVELKYDDEFQELTAEPFLEEIEDIRSEQQQEIDDMSQISDFGELETNAYDETTEEPIDFNETVITEDSESVTAQEQQQEDTEDELQDEQTEEPKQTEVPDELNELLDDDLLALLSDDDDTNNTVSSNEAAEEESNNDEVLQQELSGDNNDVENLYDGQEIPAGENVELDLSQEPVSEETIKKTKKLAVSAALIVLLAIGGGAGAWYMHHKNNMEKEAMDASTGNEMFDFQNQGSNADSADSAAVPQDINKSMTNSFSDKPAAISITKLSWQINEKLAVEPSVKEYLQTAGKNIQMNLQNDLANASDIAFNNNVKVSFEIAPDNTMKGIQVLESSGSDKIDEAITKSIKNTLKYVSVPKLPNYKSDYFLTLIINF